MAKRIVPARRGQRGERGAAVVEAAIILPLLLMLTFGALEFGLAFRDSAGVASASRSGARIGSAMPAQDGFQDSARMSVNEAVKDLTHSTPVALVIYKANTATGLPVSGTFASCGDCYRYAWDAAAKQFSSTASGEPWTAAEQEAELCTPGGTAAIGVYLEAQHDFITGLFGAFSDYDHKTVMMLEPIDPEICTT
jgi:Flp pilus assembly protein TadG